MTMERYSSGLVSVTEKCIFTWRGCSQSLSNEETINCLLVSRMQRHIIRRFSSYEHLPQFFWHQLAAPQKSAPVPQKLLPEQHSPFPHFLFTIGPHVSPSPERPGWPVGRAGFFSLSHFP